MQQIDRRNKSILLTNILIVVGLSIVMIGCDYFFKPPSFEEVMKEPTKELNKKCPVMIDQETRFDSGVILPNKAFEYNYTLINHDTSSINVKELRKDVYSVLLKRVKTDPDFQILRKNKATIVYHYRDKNRKTLFKLFFTPTQYLN